MKFNSVDKLCEAIVSGEGVVQLDFPGAGGAACIFYSSMVVLKSSSVLWKQQHDEEWKGKKYTTQYHLQ